MFFVSKGNLFYVYLWNAPLSIVLPTVVLLLYLCCFTLSKNDTYLYGWLQEQTKDCDLLAFNDFAYVYRQFLLAWKPLSSPWNKKKTNKKKTEQNTFIGRVMGICESDYYQCRCYVLRYPNSISINLGITGLIKYTTFYANGFAKVDIKKTKYLTLSPCRPAGPGLPDSPGSPTCPGGPCSPG